MPTAGSAPSRGARSAFGDAAYTPPAAGAVPAAPAPGGRPPRVAIFRWRGVAVLALLAGAAASGTVLFGERLVRETTEEAGAGLLGTQVDVAGLRIAPRAALVELRGVQIADPADPLRNLVEVARVEAHLEPLPLLERKLVVRRLRVRGVRLDTRRATPARPADPDAPGPRALRELRRWSAQFRQPVLAYTPVDTLRALVLDPTQLATVRAALAAAARADSVRDALARGYAGLRLAETADSVQTVAARLAAADVRTLGLAGARAAVGDVRRTAAQVDSAQRRLRALEQDTRAAAALLRASVGQLDSARRQDYAFARGLLALPRFDAPEIGGALFGAVSIERFEQALYWMTLAEEHFPPGLRPRESAGPDRLRASGTTVRFATPRAYPRLHVRAADVDFTLADGAAAGRYTAAFSDLTSDPAIVARPTRFAVRGAGRGTAPFLLRAHGVLDHRGAQPRAAVTATVDRVVLPDFPLPGLHGRVAPGRSASRLVLDRRGGQIAAEWTLRAPAVRWHHEPAAGARPPLVESLVWRVVGGIDDVELAATLRGELGAPTLAVRSNLDRAIAERMRAVAGEELARGEARARAAVDRLVEARTAPVRARVATLQADAEARVADGRRRLDDAQARVSAARARIEAQADSVARGALPARSLIEKLQSRPRLPKL